MNEHNHRQQIQQRVRELRQFYLHLLVYLAVNFGLLLLNLVTLTEGVWFVWPLLGWGIGLAAHALNVYGVSHWFDADWEEREIQRRLREDA